MKTTIANLINSNGNTVMNQFVITVWENGLVKAVQFQSYDSLVCDVRLNCGMGYDAHVVLGRDYDYSRTTMRHLVKFLSDLPCTNDIKNMADLRKAIERGYATKENIRYSYDETMR